jgi:hypothetical protein
LKSSFEAEKGKTGLGKNVTILITENIVTNFDKMLSFCYNIFFKNDIVIQCALHKFAFHETMK